jgi:hypothetical protein
MSPGIVYLVVISLPVYLLYRYGPRRWYCHALALAAALGAGMVPIPLALQKQSIDLTIGFVLVALFVWAAGGLLLRLFPSNATKTPLSH